MPRLESGEVPIDNDVKHSAASPGPSSKKKNAKPKTAPSSPPKKASPLKAGKKLEDQLNAAAETTATEPSPKHGHDLEEELMAMRGQLTALMQVSIETQMAVTSVIDSVATDKKDRKAADTKLDKLVELLLAKEQREHREPAKQPGTLGCLPSPHDRMLQNANGKGGTVGSKPATKGGYNSRPSTSDNRQGGSRNPVPDEIKEWCRKNGKCWHCYGNWTEGHRCFKKQHRDRKDQA